MKDNCSFYVCKCSSSVPATLRLIFSSIEKVISANNILQYLCGSLLKNLPWRLLYEFNHVLHFFFALFPLNIVCHWFLFQVQLHLF